MSDRASGIFDSQPHAPAFLPVVTRVAAENDRFAATLDMSQQCAVDTEAAIADREMAKVRRDHFRTVRATAKEKGAAGIQTIEEVFAARVVEHEATLRRVDEEERLAATDFAQRPSEVRRADELLREAEGLVRANRKVCEVSWLKIDRDPNADERIVLPKPIPPPHVARTERVGMVAALRVTEGVQSGPQAPPDDLSLPVAIGGAQGTVTSANYSECKRLQMELLGASPEDIFGYVRGT